MADPAIRAVTLTVTEGGYFIDPAKGGFDAEHPEIVHDAQHPDRPCTAYGAMVAAWMILMLKTRWPLLRIQLFIL